MTLTAEDLKEFQAIWKSTFHEEIDIEEAARIASDVIHLYGLLAHSKMPESESETSTRSDEIFSLLQEIERKRGSAGPVN